MSVINETDGVTHVLLYGKDFFIDEVKLLISNVAIDFVDFFKKMDEPIYRFWLQDHLSLFAIIIKNLI